LIRYACSKKNRAWSLPLAYRSSLPDFSQCAASWLPAVRCMGSCFHGQDLDCQGVLCGLHHGHPVSHGWVPTWQQTAKGSTLVVSRTFA
jgi:hypothetical protein